MHDEFTDMASVSFGELGVCVKDCVYALNDVLHEGSKMHPLSIQRESASRYHQIGLGTFGVADMLIKLKLTYGSINSIRLLEAIYRWIAVCAIEASCELAQKYGCYAGCNKNKILESDFIKNLNITNELYEDIKKYGLYNSQILTCAPTGSIATMFGVSTGVEPIYAMHYTRTTKSLEGKDAIFDVYAPIAKKWIDLHNGEKLPEYFVESADISPEDRIKVQASLQRYVDAAISSTVNLPKHASKDDVYSIYMNAWKNGLKGITIFRDGCKRIAILNKESPVEINNVPRILPAQYEEIMVKGERFAVMVGLYNDKPYEIFVTRINKSIGRHMGQIVKLKKKSYEFQSDKTTINLSDGLTEFEASAAIHTSLELRHGIPLEFIIKASKKANENIASFSSAMCRVLSKYLPKEELDETCPDCGGKLIREGGCIHCSSCEYSKCE